MLKHLLQGISGLGLLLTIGPSWLVFTGQLSWETHANLMLLGTAVWFITAPFWMRSKPEML
uniref:Uncharacterized protein n=1 Tax=Rhodothermus marinus TaxID=29549 RepID=A0A7V2AZZ8_RHOMR